MGQIECNGFVVQGVSQEVRNDDPQGIGALWAQFHGMELRSKLPHVLSEDVVCVYHSYLGSHLDPFTMTIGFRVAEEAEDVAGLSKVTIPSQSFELFDVNGPQPETLVQQWQLIWDSGLNRTFTADYDVYDHSMPDKVTIYVGVTH